MPSLSTSSVGEPEQGNANAVASHGSGMPMRRLGSLLIERRLLSEGDLARALSFQQMYGGRLGAILIRLGAISEDYVLECLSTQLALPIITQDTLPQDPQVYVTAVRRFGIDAEWWFDQSALVWIDDKEVLNCVCRDPLAPILQETINVNFSGTVQWWLVRARDLDLMIDLVRRDLSNEDRDLDGDVAHLRELAEEAPVVELVSNTLAQALGQGASDIHFEPKEGEFEIRYRIDGVLQKRLSLPRSRFDAVASRLKLIAGMDIAERRLPQDGRIGTRISGVELDIRVSCLPGLWGESIVMRLLMKEQKALSLENIGMASDHLELFAKLANEPHGIILVTGPTGSGKSTTLKATLDHIKDGKKKIITVEDPVEYQIDGVTQVQTKSDIGYSFARALRSILRQDPDVIMIGEIRDLETAQIAVQASLTGHMVFSTLHTNDALGAYSRLTDMGVEPFLVSSSVRLVMAQRLVRRLCPHCKVPQEPSALVKMKCEDLKRRFEGLLPDQPQWYGAAGCKQCQGTGYRGRLGIYEVSPMTDDIADLVMRQRPTHELMAVARQHQFRDLFEDGLLKAYRGETSVDDVIRVAGQTAIDAE
jgi:general secretion pathway protein E